MHMCGFNIKIRIVTTSNVFTTCHTGIGKGKKITTRFLSRFLFIKFTLRSNFELNFMFFFNILKYSSIIYQ